MRKTDLERCEKKLLAKREALSKELGIIRESHLSSTIKDATGDLSSYSYHMADLGTDAMEREMAFLMASKTGRLIYHIDEALRRIKDGSYGKCVNCKKSISPARLQSVPHARMCIDCKSSEEGGKAGRK